jgi:hypothetical protein
MLHKSYISTYNLEEFYMDKSFNSSDHNLIRSEQDINLWIVISESSLSVREKQYIDNNFLLHKTGKLITNVCIQTQKAIGQVLWIIKPNEAYLWDTVPLVFLRLVKENTQNIKQGVFSSDFLEWFFDVSKMLRIVNTFPYEENGFYLESISELLLTYERFFWIFRVVREDRRNCTEKNIIQESGKNGDFDYSFKEIKWRIKSAEKFQKILKESDELKEWEENNWEWHDEFLSVFIHCHKSIIEELRANNLTRL